MDNHETAIVRKPWGYEYLAYRNSKIALWVLHIAKDQKTSLHCHPSKMTGLVVVDGTAELNFIADSRQLTAPDKQMIRRGLFHQTKAITDVVMFEFETPVDKNDLVRLKDEYGRTDSAYESSQFELPKSSDCLWIADTDQIQEFTVGKCTVTVEPADMLDVVKSKNPTDIIVFLNGGLIKTIEGRTHLVTQPGDVGLAQVVQQVASEMDGWAQDTVLMTIKKNKDSK